MIVMECLEKDPARRHPSAHAPEVNRHLQGELERTRERLASRR